MASPVQLKVLMDLSDGVTFSETSDLCFDISDIVMTANTRRGRNQQLDKIQAGYAVLTIVDENGDFNPDNTASPYYGRLVPGRKIRLYPLYDDGTGEFRYPDIFTGYVSNYNLKFSVGVDTANEVIIEAYDALRIFNSVSITDVVNSTSGDTCDERIDAILDEISWPAPLRDFETSLIQLDADQGDMRTVLDAVRQVEDTEAGLFYIDGSGVAQFKNRETVNIPPSALDVYYFADDGTATSYNDLKLIQDDALLYNKVTVRSYNGTDEITVTDTSSIDTYFTRSAERNNVLLSASTDLESLADTLLANNKDSALEIQSIMLNLSEYEQIDRVIAGLYFDIFFIPINVEKTLAGDTSISRLGYVHGVNHDISHNRWFVTAFTGLTDENIISDYFIGSRNATYLTNVVRATDNSLYVSESKTGGSSYIYKLNADTSKSWTIRNITVPQNIDKMAVDSDNNLYIAARRTSDDRGIVAKYNTSGVLQWNKRVELNNTKFTDLVIKDTTIYAVSQRYLTTRPYLFAFDLDGNEVFQKKLNVAAGNSVSYYENSVYAAEDDYITKYETNGTVVWNYSFSNLPTDASAYRPARIHAKDYDGDIWVTGTVAYTGTSTTKAHIMRLDDNGTNATIAEQYLFDLNSASLDLGQSIVSDNSGNTYVLLYVEDGSSDPVFLSKFDSLNNQLWQRKITPGFGTLGASVEVGPKNLIYWSAYKSIAAVPNNGDKTGTYTVSTGFETTSYEAVTYATASTAITLTNVTSSTETSTLTYATNAITTETSALSLTILEI